MNSILATQKLSKHFGRIKAVNDMQLNITSGQVFGMLGPNGSGKTTTLGMLMGVIHPTSGGFTWFGQPPSHHVRKRIGAVLEHPIFYPYLSGRLNLELNAKIKQADPANIDRVLRLVELEPRKDDKYKTYSLGMKQRLAIASAMVSDPEVLILDEPTNGLDPMGIIDIRKLIKRIADEGKTIILASHLLDEVQKVCSHFAILQQGNTIHTGSVEDVNSGIETVEVKADHKGLDQLLESFTGTSKVQMEKPYFTVTLKESYNSIDLNRFLIEKGVIVSHLLTRKKSLEKQFLEILGHHAPST